MISGVVYLTSKTIYGFTSRKTPIYMFQPFDDSIKPFLVGCSEKDTSRNILALCKCVSEPGVKIRKGFIEQIIGKCGILSKEEEAVLWRYAPIRWKKNECNIQIPSFENHPLLDVPTINIDPAGCRDIDDCVSIWNEDNKTYVGITIADVHEWVECNLGLVEKASLIGQTFYNDGKVVVPMFPPILSELYCSLIPGEYRLGLTLQFEWNGTMIQNLHLKQTTIINKKSYTYDDVKEAKDFPISILKDIASWLAGKETNDPHEWVEQLMLFYNREVAELLQKYEKGIWRGHSEPDYNKLTKFKEFGVGIEFLAQKAALYTDKPSKHWGLGDVPYCHASSPIRRWADVVNQSIIKKRKILPFDIEHLNTVCKHVKQYERDIFFMRTLAYSKHNGITGTCIDANEKRIRLWIAEWKRIITIPNVSLEEGKTVSVHYFLEYNHINWKKRLVFRVEDTSYPELLLPVQSVVEYYEECLESLDRSLSLPK
jgi:exoribonuclease II